MGLCKNVDQKNTNNKLTMGSIKRWTKLEDPEKYKEIIKNKPYDMSLFKTFLKNTE